MDRVFSESHCSESHCAVSDADLKNVVEVTTDSTRTGLTYLLRDAETREASAFARRERTGMRYGDLLPMHSGQ